MPKKSNDLDENMTTKKHNDNTEWINTITRELEGLEEGPKMEIHIDLLKTTLKRILNWKTPGHDGINGFWIKKFTSIHYRLALEMNRCLQAVDFVRYSGPFLKWTRDELKQMDQRTRKLVTMHKALHPRDDVDRLYVSRKGGGRGFANIEDKVDASIQRLEDYIEKHERGLITAIRNDMDNTIDNRITTRKQKWKKNPTLWPL